MAYRAEIKIMMIVSQIYDCKKKSSFHLFIGRWTVKGDLKFGIQNLLPLYIDDFLTFQTTYMNKML